VEVDGARYETRTPPAGVETPSPRGGVLGMRADGYATFVGDGYELGVWGGPDAAFALDCPGGPR
jgi:hypothetical protein